MPEEFNCSASPVVISVQDATYSHGRWVFLTILHVTLIAFPVLFTFIFWWAKVRAKYERLRIRKTILVCTSCLVCILQSEVGPGFVMYGIENFPCWLRSFIVMMIVPLTAMNLVSRLMVFFYLNELSREMTQLQDEDITENNDHFLKRLKTRSYDIIFALYALIVPSSRKMQRWRTIQAMTFVASAKGTFAIFVVICIPFLLAAVGLCVSNEVYLKCNGCRLSLTEIVEIIVAGSVFIIFGIIAGYRVRKYPDPWGLRREVTLMLGWGVFLLFAFLIATYQNPPNDVWYDNQLLLVIGFVGFTGVQSIYQVGKAYVMEKQNSRSLSRRRRERYKSVTDTNARSSQGQLLLMNVLANPVLCGLFEDFLVAELGVESLMFLKDTDSWKQSYFDIAPSARFARAKRLYNLYISSNGTFPVNIQHSTVTEIRLKLLVEGLHDCEESVFNTARDEVAELLQVGSLIRFQNSPEYMSFLNNT